MTVRTIDEVFRDYVTDGVPSSGAWKPVKADIRDTLNHLLPSTDSTAFVIFASGQSNIMNRPAVTVTVPPNVRYWNFWGALNASSDVGTAFVTPDGTWMSTALGFAIEAAKLATDRTIYVIDISKGGMEIANWGESPPDYDFREAIEGNLPVAMAAAGADTIDVMLWWQGEGDASLSSATYITDFNALHTYLRGQDWFRYDSPIVMFGLPEWAQLDSVPTAVYANYTSYILGCVAYDTDTRMFVRPSVFPAADYWDATGPINYIHMNGAGYEAAGRLAFITWAFGIGRNVIDGRIRNPTTGNMVDFGNGVAPTIPSATEEWSFHKDQAAATNLLIKNLSTSASAVTVLNLMTDTGTFAINCTPNAGTKAAQINWNQSGGIGFNATHASGSISFSVGGFNTALTLRSDKAPVFSPPAGPTSLGTNGMVTFELTNNTTLTFRARGSDGTSRTGTITLA